MKYIVISDLHIGADTKLDIFSSQAQLSGFLRSFAGEPFTLIINGDFLDFLAVDPPEFSRKAAQEKVGSIINAKGNKLLWDGFRAFLKLDTRNRIDVLLGNHDVELAFTEVQEALQKVMSSSGEAERINFITDRVSHQEVKVGQVPIHIEHGFQFDPYNWYDQDKLKAAALFKDSKTAFDLPVGSRLVYEVLNKLTPDHPFLPLIKPETGGVYILLAIAPKEVSTHLGTMTGIFKERYFNKLRMRVRGQQFLPPKPKDLQGGADVLEPQLTDMLFDSGLSEPLLNDLAEYMEVGNDRNSTSVSFNSISRAARTATLYLLRKGLKGLQEQRDTFFDAEARDEFKPSLERILDLGAKVAILGHSHARKMLDLTSDDSSRRLLYLNTGTWANLLDVDLALLESDEALSTWIQDLSTRRFTPVLQLTFARLTELPGGKGARISLEEWDNGTIKQLGLAREISA